MAEALRSERRWCLGTFRTIAVRKVPLSVDLSAEPASIGEQVKGVALRYLYPKSWAYGALDGYLNAVISEAERPYARRRRVTPPNDPYVAMLIRNYDDFGFVFAKNDAHLRLLRLELALQEYRKRHGRYPATLAQLASEITTAVPLDPFTERPLVYRLQGSAYLLYSLGPDQADDGGTPASTRNLGPKTRGDLVAGRLGPQRTQNQ